MIARHHLMGAAAQGTALATFALFGTDQARKHLKQFDGSTAAAANNPMSTPQQWAYNLAQPIAERSILLPIPMMVACVLALLLGSLIPDIDNPKSTLGRYFNWKGPHHGILHAVWIPVALLVISLMLPATAGAVIFWLAIGWFSHLFYDFKTKGSIVLFYPLTPHDKTMLGNTEFIAPLHTMGYWGPKTGSSEETRCVVISCILWLMLAFMMMPHFA